MSRTRRSVQTYVAGLFLNVLTILVGFLIMPAVLRMLGEERFGAARAAQDWLSSLSIVDAAILSGLLPLLARAYAIPDPDRLRRIIATGLVTYLKLIAATLAAGCVLIAFLPRLVPVDPSLRIDLRLGGAIGLVSMLFIPLGIFRGMIEARQQGYLIHVMVGAQAITVSLTSLAFAWSGWGITGQFAAALCGQTLLAVMLFFEAWISSRAILRGVRPATDPVVWAEMKKLNFHSLVLQICGRLSLMADNVIIAALLEPALLVPFLMSQRLASFVGGQLLGLGNSAWAALAELHQTDLNRFNDRLIELTRITVFLGAGTLVPASIYTEHFVALWVGPSRFAGPLVVWLASSNVLTLAFFSLWGWAITGTGNTARVTPILLIGTLLNVVISLAATSQWGVSGPLLGTFLTNVCFYLWLQPRVLNSLFGTPIPRLYIAIAAPILAAVPFGLLLNYIAHAIPPDNWIELILHLVISPLLYFVPAAWFVFPSSERQEWAKRIRSFRFR